MHLEISACKSMRLGQPTSVRVTVVDRESKDGTRVNCSRTEGCSLLVRINGELAEAEADLDDDSASFRVEPCTSGNLTLEFSLIGSESCPKAVVTIVVEERVGRRYHLLTFIMPHGKNSSH
jgi:hypothetical protein